MRPNGATAALIVGALAFAIIVLALILTAPLAASRRDADIIVSGSGVGTLASADYKDDLR